MDMAQELLEEYRQRMPSKHIIFMDGSEEKQYYKEYIDFNLELFRRVLSMTRLQFETVGEEWMLIMHPRLDAWGLFRDLLFESAIFGSVDSERGGVLLSARIFTCSLMSACCALLERFEK